MDIDRTLRDISLLAARVTLGGSLAMHGAQKMFGIQDGPGLDGTSNMMESLGFKPGKRFAPALAAAEMTSGAMIASGTLGPVGPAVLLSVMLVAIETVHRPKGYWNQNGGFEMNAMYVMLALVLANEGYGRLSVDELAGLRAKLRPMHAWISLAGGVAAALLILAQREQRAQQNAGRADEGSASQDRPQSQAVTTNSDGRVAAGARD